MSELRPEGTDPASITTHRMFNLFAREPWSLRLAAHRDLVLFDSDLGSQVDRGLNVLHGWTPEGEYKSKEEKSDLGVSIDFI